MALTMKTFGRLISVVTNFVNFSLEDDQIDLLHDIAMNIATVEPKISDILPPKINLVPLFDAMIEGKKIDAIREHRSLTGMGLKESKDEVERLMGMFAVPQSKY